MRKYGNLRKFYDDSILPGTKTGSSRGKRRVFYDDSILPGTKTLPTIHFQSFQFYDDSILPGTKTGKGYRWT